MLLFNKATKLQIKQDSKLPYYLVTKLPKLPNT